MRKSVSGGQTFSIIVPLYNEEEVVPVLIETVLREVGDEAGFLELLLIDDGSRDGTVEKVLEYGRSEPRIRLVRHGRNRGLGAGIRTGLEQARGDLVLYTDADLPFDFSLIPGLIRLGGPDRVVSGSRLNRGEGPRRWIFTKIYNLLIYLVCGLRMRDINFACKVIPRGFAERVSLRSEGSFIDAELMLEAVRMGMEVVEYPMTYYPRTMGQSTLSSPKVIVGIINELARYLLRSVRGDLDSPSIAARSPLIKYGLGVAASFFALLLALKFPISIFGMSPFFPLAVLAVSLVVGILPGLLTATISWLAINVALTPPFWSLYLTRHDILKVAVLLSMALLVSGINAVKRSVAGSEGAWAED